jgi:hypothetical protein
LPGRAYCFSELAFKVESAVQSHMSSLPEKSPNQADQESGDDLISLEGVAELYQAGAGLEDRRAKRRALAQRVRDCELRLEMAGPESRQICRQELELAQSELAGFELTPEVEQSVGPDLGPDLDWGR